MPATAARLLVLATDPDVEIEDLASVIEDDPPLNARLIGLANSAFYSPQPPVTDIRAAMIRVLGLDIVRNMALGMALSGGFSSARCPRFDLMAYWLSALGVSDLVSGLVRASSNAALNSPSEGHLVGLLHNIGELLMVHLWPQEMDEVYRLTAENPGMSQEEHEQGMLGLDHWQAGAFLCRHWELPAVVAESIEALGRDTPSDEQPLAALLGASRRWMLAMIAGCNHVLQVDGVDEAYSEYRAANFRDRIDELRALARAMI